jgi:hypothetical protein
VNVLPDTAVTRRISESIRRRKLPEEGNAAALATVRLAAPAVTAAARVDWAELANCSAGMDHPWGCSRKVRHTSLTRQRREDSWPALRSRFRLVSAHS